MQKTFLAHGFSIKFSDIKILFSYPTHKYISRMVLNTFVGKLFEKKKIFVFDFDFSQKMTKNTQFSSL